MPYGSAMFFVSCADKSVMLQLQHQIMKDLTAMWTMYHNVSCVMCKLIYLLTYFLPLMCCLHMHALAFSETVGVRNTRYSLENRQS